MAKILIASDHAGFHLKEELKKHFTSEHEFIDFGPNSSDSVDYPDYAHILSQKISESKDSFGILICGSGIGMSMVANRYKDVRAALCLNEKMANVSKTDIKNAVKEVYDADVEAIRNLSGLATNLTQNGKLVIPGGLEIDGEVTMKKGLKITGRLDGQGSNCLELVGGLKVNNGTVVINRSDDYRALDVIAKGGIKVTGDVNAEGNGYFGPAYIGKHAKNNSNYAQFSHKDRTGKSDYALLQKNDGNTYMNASKSKNLYILKSQIVPPVCPACPPVIEGGGCPSACKAKCAPCPRPPPIPPCPPCERCPEPQFKCKKVPDYRNILPGNLPRPLLNDFSQFT